MLTVNVLEVGELDALSLAQHVCRGTEAVHKDPDIAGVQYRQIGGTAAAALDGMLDIGPSGHDRAEHNKTKGEQGQATDRAAEKQDFAIRGHDNRQVFENRVHWN